jgi:hypothetical protein
VVSQDKAGNPARPLPAAGEGFLETNGAGISLITWKAAEDGNGTIVRLAETNGKPTEGGPPLFSFTNCGGKHLLWRRGRPTRTPNRGWKYPPFFESIPGSDRPSSYEAMTLTRGRLLNIFESYSLRGKQ